MEKLINVNNKISFGQFFMDEESLTQKGISKEYQQELSKCYKYPSGLVMHELAQ